MRAAYARAKDLDKANAIDKEIQGIALSAGSTTPENPFKKGSVWIGVRTILDSDDPGKEIKYKLVVTQQNGMRFRGEYSLDDRHRTEWIAEGLVKGNRVEFNEIGNAKYRMNIVGQLNSGSVSYEFKGVRADGGKRFGKGELTPQER